MSLEPGFYKVTARGVSDQVLILTDADSDYPWVIAQGADSRTRWCRHDEVTDARPLIAFDLGSGEFAAKMMIETLSAAQSLIGNSTRDVDKQAHRIKDLQRLISQIEAQVKPAQEKPS